MLKSELVSLVAECCAGLTKTQVKYLVDDTFDYICEALATGSKVELRGFGTFYVRTNPPRIARNPKTGASVSLGAVSVPSFKAGKDIRAKLSDD
ncbi:integration host factor subunit beta [Deferribacterales bacterium RsTz2092]|nr:integration host factor subunit beta [Deferribacterales bacterium]